MFPEKDWIITFEGICDCSGKTSLINKFNEQTKFRYLLRDRSTLSVKVYDKKFNRNVVHVNNAEKYIANYKWHLLVYLSADFEDVKKRQASKNDGYDSDDYYIDRALFDEELEKSYYSKVLRLNSSHMTYKEEIELILDEMRRYENIDNLIKDDYQIHLLEDNQ